MEIRFSIGLVAGFFFELVVELIIELFVGQSMHMSQAYQTVTAKMMIKINQSRRIADYLFLYHA